MGIDAVIAIVIPHRRPFDLDRLRDQLVWRFDLSEFELVERVRSSARYYDLDPVPAFDYDLIYVHTGYRYSLPPEFKPCLWPHLYVIIKYLIDAYKEPVYYGADYEDTMVEITPGLERLWVEWLED